MCDLPEIDLAMGLELHINAGGGFDPTRLKIGCGVEVLVLTR